MLRVVPLEAPAAVPPAAERPVVGQPEMPSLEPPRPTAAPEPRKKVGPIRRAVGMVVLLAVIAVAVTLLLWVKAYRVTSGSMEPTALVGQRILADHLGDSKWMPKVGDVIVFNAPGGAAPFVDQECATKRAPGTACLSELPGTAPTSFLKRVVGLPGDRLAVVAGHVIRNGAREHDPYATSCHDESCNLVPFTVPAGHYFVMGDNRGDSDDSRFWGPVTRSQITGHVFASYWPLSRLGGI